MNSFFGDAAGRNITTGGGNVFVGAFAAANTKSGNSNTAIGANSDISDSLVNATAIGGAAQVTQNNSLVLGAIKGKNGAGADTNVGIGTTAPQSLLHVAGNARIDGDVTLFSLGAAKQYSGHSMS